MWRIGRGLVEEEGEGGGEERGIKKLKVKYTQLAHDKVNSYNVQVHVFKRLILKKTRRCIVYTLRTSTHWMCLQMINSLSLALKTKLQRYSHIDMI